MSADQIVLLAIGLIAIAGVAVTVAYATAHAGRRRAGPALRQGQERAQGPRVRADDPVERPAPPPQAATRNGTSLVSPASTRQVARVVAFLYLAAVVVVVALTRAWPENEPAIFTLLAGGSLLVVLFMDMLPQAALGRWRRPIEGVGAIVFLGLIMALTGGAQSPFVVGFFLVVAGTALATEGMAPLALAVLAALTVALVGLASSWDDAIQAQGLAWIGFNVVALILLADIAAAAARAQRHAREEALRASRFDALTGLFNRAFFFTTMEQEIRRSDRMGRGFTMLMLDLDDLKPVNDTFGHQWGDRLLKAVADVVRQTVRFTDSAARYGGDEFVVLLPETDASGGYVVGEKLRRDIASLALLAGDRNVRSSVSIGLVTYPEDGTTIEQLVAAADVAMYESKRRGKNRIVGYQTRTERIATAIEVGPEVELVQLSPGGDVRTGGDPAPWLGGQGASGRESEPGGGREPGGGPLPQGRSERRALPIEPDPDAPPWPLAEPTPAAVGPEPRLPERPEPTPRGSESEPRGGSAATDEPAERSRPWLTRTDGRSVDEGRPTPRRPSEGAEPSGPQPPGREGRRSDRIRSTGDRPWIALPIEPREPPDRPKGPRDGPKG